MYIHTDNFIYHKSVFMKWSDNIILINKVYFHREAALGMYTECVGSIALFCSWMVSALSLYFTLYPWLLSLINC